MLTCGRLTRVSQALFLLIPQQRRSTLFPYTTLFRSAPYADGVKVRGHTPFVTPWRTIQIADKVTELSPSVIGLNLNPDWKSTRLNSSHRTISYAVFCL